MNDQLSSQFELTVAIQQMLIEKKCSAKEIVTWYHDGDNAVTARVYQVKEKE